MVDFNFYPHSCVIYRSAERDTTTGETIPIEIYRGRCYLQQGSTNLKGEWLQGENTVKLDSLEVPIKTGDKIEITLENGLRYVAIVKQSYPIKDEELGGQDLKLYQEDGIN